MSKMQILFYAFRIMNWYVFTYISDDSDMKY